MIVLLALVAACGGGGILPGVGSPYSSAKVGDIIQFGGLDWIVLTVENGKALILSEKVLEERAYHQEWRDPYITWYITWEECSLREFLNGSFYNSTFNDQEKRLISETRLTNLGGNDTDDRVFLLSVDEVNEYMGDNAHVNMRNAKRAELLNSSWGVTSRWWLRPSPHAVIVDGDGRVLGIPITARSDSNVGVRPALWLNL